MKNYIPTIGQPRRNEYKFLGTHNLPKLKQGEMENLNRSDTSNEIESVIKKLPKNKKTQDQMVSQLNSTKHVKKS